MTALNKINNKCILVVTRDIEKNPLAEQLRNEGYDVELTDCGNEAEEKLKARRHGLIYICDSISPDYHEKSEELMSSHELTDLLFHINQHPEQEYLLANRNLTVLEDLSKKLIEANKNSRIIAFSSFPFEVLNKGIIHYHLRKGYGEFFVPE